MINATGNRGLPSRPVLAFARCGVGRLNAVTLSFTGSLGCDWMSGGVPWPPIPA